VQIIIAPSFTALRAMADAIQGCRIDLAAQNIQWEDSGPYTGEVSVPQVKDAGCRYVIIGHSERRQYFGEGYDQVNRKIQATIRHELYPIVCLGETLSEREAKKTFNIIGEQMAKGLAGLDPLRFEHLLIAYEPVWAIGTGQTVTPQQATETHQFIKTKVGELFGATSGRSVRVLYGGSVTAQNVSEFLAEPEVDGLLVGGASLDIEDFTDILKHSAFRRP
jgi:triosephosphate isomerase (TIM)